MASISNLIGKTVVDIKNNDNRSLEFVCNNGETFVMYHNQDCCENVRIEDIEGSLSDLIGNQIIQAEENSNRENQPDEYAESWTWTFYKLATIKGYVTIRWLGSSNGYYSESVEFEKQETIES